jgi:hypothetical protein
MWLCPGLSVYFFYVGVLAVLHPINLRLYGRGVGDESVQFKPRYPGRLAVGDETETQY